MYSLKQIVMPEHKMSAAAKAKASTRMKKVQKLAKAYRKEHPKASNPSALKHAFAQLKK